LINRADIKSAGVLHLASELRHRISLRRLSVPHDDPTMQRLEDQIQWYDSRSIKHQRMFQVLKIIVIFAAALIRFLVGLNLPLAIAESHYGV
jgi:hypothetical protein